MSTLSDEEKFLLSRITGARKMTAYLLFCCCFFLGAVNGAALALNTDMPPSIYGLVLLCIAGIVWSILLLIEQKKNAVWIKSNASLTEITGVPKKIGRAVAVPSGAPGLMLFKQLKQGVVHLEGKSYGTMPGLFSVLEDGVRATFEIAPLKFGGISGVIVHYQK